MLRQRISALVLCSSGLAVAAACGGVAIGPDVDSDNASQNNPPPGVQCMGGIDDDGDGEWDRMSLDNVFETDSIEQCRALGGAVLGGIPAPVEQSASAITAPSPSPTESATPTPGPTESPAPTPDPDPQPAPGEACKSEGTEPSGCTKVVEASDELKQDVKDSGVQYGKYVPKTHDCDDFADELEDYLEGLGYHATFTIVRTDKNGDGDVCDKEDSAHAVTDVHEWDDPREVTWFEPQTGKPINLDKDKDGQVGHDEGNNCKKLTEADTRVEIYESAQDAIDHGVKLD